MRSNPFSADLDVVEKRTMITDSGNGGIRCSDMSKKQRRRTGSNLQTVLFVVLMLMGIASRGSALVEKETIPRILEEGLLDHPDFSRGANVAANNENSDSTNHKPFGTMNGYDAEDGTEAICFGVNLGTKNMSFSNDDMLSAEELDRTQNEEFGALTNMLFDDTSLFAAVPYKCFAGTSFTFAPVEDSKTFRTGQIYTFSFNLTTTPSELSTTGRSVVTPNVSTWFRFLMCNSTNIGFCHPYLDSRAHDGTLDETTVSSEYTDGELLEPRKSEFGNHIYSRYFKVPMSSTTNADEQTVLNANIEVDFLLPEGDGGKYFMIGHAVLFVASGEDPLAIIQARVDIGAAVPNNVIEFKEPPKISTVTPEFAIGVYCFLGILVAIHIAILILIWVNRKHTVISISQGPFLMFLVFCGLVSTASTALYMPLSSISCNLKFFLVFIPLQMISATLVGRLWRVHSILVMALRSKFNGRRRRKLEVRVLGFLELLSNWDRIFKICGVKREYDRGLSLRKKVSSRDLIRLIVILTLPQAIIQIMHYIFFPEEIEVQLNEAGTIGREMCSEKGVALHAAGGFVLLVTFSLLVVVAWISSDLPSLFNEKEAIFTSAWVNIFVTPIIAALMILHDTPTSSANVTVRSHHDARVIIVTIAFPNPDNYFKAMVGILGVLTTTLTLTLCVVYPKLKKVFSGEKVVVSRLFHSSNSSSFGLESAESERASWESSNIGGPAVADEDMVHDSQNKISTELPATHEDGGMLEEAPPGTRMPKKKHVKKSTREMMLTKDDPIPRKLEMNLLELRDLISSVNKCSAEGKHIRMSDWEVLREHVGVVNTSLQHLKCSWNEDEER